VSFSLVCECVCVCISFLFPSYYLSLSTSSEMKSLFALLLLVAAVSAQDLTATNPSCHPVCKWACDDPQCPAICHPVCARPKCEMKCEEVSCAKCTIHCERPVCSIRCPKDTCEKTTCHACETVCQPARCHTTCVAPEPQCSPVCEELDCSQKCIKPTNCARPKCELQCEKAACDADDKAAANACCACDSTTTQLAITSANNACTVGACTTLRPSFLETFHTILHKEKNGVQGCCPCAH
jgi:hypothetical protein